MKGLAKFLVETILGEAAKIDKVVVVYSGRFQPFHKGHYATYDHLVKKFGKDNVYIGTSDVTDSKKSPFNFKEKKAIMMKMFGIPSSKIVNVRNPYAPEEILNKYDESTTGLITVVGEKDENRLGGKYFTPYKGKVTEPYLNKGYVYAAPSQPNPISGTDVRYWLSAGNAADRKKGFLKAYPKFDEQVFKMITLKLKSLKEYINEEIKLNVKVGDEILMGKFKNKKVIVKSIGKDEWGMPTINGKKAVTFRIPKKDKINETRLGGYGADAGEPETGYYTDGQPRVLNSAKPEPWMKQMGYTQLDFPKGDYMRGKGKVSKELEGPYRKVTYQLQNVVTSTLNPALDPHKTEDWEEVGDKKPINKVKRFWHQDKKEKPQIISKEDINEIIDEVESELLDEMGLPGGAGVGLSLPGGYINGAPNPKDVKKLKSKLDGDGSEEYTKVEEDNKLKGGKADGMTLNDIAKMHGVSVQNLKQEFMKGYAIEREHTSDPNVAKEIALDHLYEHPSYYTRLAVVDEKTLKEASGNGAFYNDGNATTGTMWNGTWDDYDNENYYLDGLDGWDTFHEKPSEFEKKRAVDQKLPTDDQTDGKTHKYNRILKTGLKKPADFLKVDKKLKEVSTASTAGGFQVGGIFGDSEDELEKDEHLSLKDPNGWESFNKHTNTFKKKIQEGLITEGGAYGHMNHPFDIEMNLTFGDLKQIVVRALNGDLELAREKTDGQALAISWVNGRLVAARNKSHTKNQGEGAMTIGQVAQQFANRGALTDAYTFAMNDLSNAVASLTEPQRKKIFKDGACFMNLEVIYPKNSNVIPYGQNLLVFHGTFEYNKEGEVVGENQQAASILAGMIKQVNKHVQDTYTIQGPPMQSLPKSQELSKLQSKYISMINKLQKEFKLSDLDGVADYHQAWWENFVEKNAKKLDINSKIGLVKRWAFGDKSFRITQIQDSKIKAWADRIEKQDQQKIMKENIMKFEQIFLGVGADVLSFMESVLTANPSDATKQLRKELGNAIKQIKASGNPQQIEKLKTELSRLNAIGGFDKIVPNEGLVFVYGGNTYKLTGAFAPLNQILGIFKYGR